MSPEDRKRWFSGKRPVYLLVAVLFVWTLTIGLLYLNLSDSNNDGARQMAINAARAYFNKDYSLRLWAASHGGIYVPVSEKTPPNPLLKGVKERDVVTPSGKVLTLMNPDYFLRNYREEFTLKYGVKGDLTSLKPLQIKNHPDEWQFCSLEKFEEGVTEEMAFVEIDNEPYLRLMQPLMTEEGCLKCHGHQGFKVGDVRGGVSVSVPMGIYLGEADSSNQRLLFTLLGIWLVGVLGVVIGGRVVTRYFWQKEEAMEEISANNHILDNKIGEINTLNKDLEAFDYTLSNALKVPIRHIEGFSKVLLDSLDKTKFRKQYDYAEIISNSSEQLRSLVDSILILSRANRQEVVREKTDLSVIAVHLLGKFKRDTQVTSFLWKVENELFCECDSSLIRLLLHNLLENAVKYSSTESANILIEVGKIEEGDRPVFYIRDNGVGFEMERAEKLFIPFHSYHEDNDFEGLGLGLATSKRIVERHGGRIWAESEAGKGATFYFTLN